MSQNLLQANALNPKVLCSVQLADTSAAAVYTAPGGGAAIIRHGTLCNVSGGSVTATVAIVPSGGTYDGSHRVLSTVPIAAGDTLPLRDFLAGACLGPGDAVYAQSSVGAALDVVLTGTEAQ